MKLYFLSSGEMNIWAHTHTGYLWTLWANEHFSIICLFIHLKILKENLAKLCTIVIIVIVVKIIGFLFAEFRQKKLKKMPAHYHLPLTTPTCPYVPVSVMRVLTNMCPLPECLNNLWQCPPLSDVSKCILPSCTLQLGNTNIARIAKSCPESGRLSRC